MSGDLRLRQADTETIGYVESLLERTDCRRVTPRTDRRVSTSAMMGTSGSASVASNATTRRTAPVSRRQAVGTRERIRDGALWGTGADRPRRRRRDAVSADGVCRRLLRGTWLRHSRAGRCAGVGSADDLVRRPLSRDGHMHAEDSRVPLAMNVSSVRHARRGRWGRRFRSRLPRPVPWCGPWAR